MSTVVKYFHAKWCNPCKAFGPGFEHVKRNNESVEFHKFDIDEPGHYAEAQKYTVRSVPTVVVEKDGVETARLLGKKVSVAELTDAIK